MEACTALLEALRLDEEDGVRTRSRPEEPKKEEEEFGVKVEAGDRVIVARARSIQVDDDDDRAATLPHRKDEHYGAGKKTATLKQDYMGSTTSLKVAREGEEKRRRGFFGGGAKQKKQTQKQKKGNAVFNIITVSVECVYHKFLFRVNRSHLREYGGAETPGGGCRRSRQSRRTREGGEERQKEGQAEDEGRASVDGLATLKTKETLQLKTVCNTPVLI